MNCLFDNQYCWFNNKAVAEYEIRENVQMKSICCKVEMGDIYFCVEILR